jgi:hypothetical protein
MGGKLIRNRTRLLRALPITGGNPSPLPLKFYFFARVTIVLFGIWSVAFLVVVVVYWGFLIQLLLLLSMCFPWD